MIVRIDNNVHAQIDDFYFASIMMHHTLSEEIVQAKKERLYNALRSLKDYAHIYPKARYKRAWRDAGYREFIAEDFHFAYEIFIIEETGEEVAYIVDACHSYLYYNEEDKYGN